MKMSPSDIANKEFKRKFRGYKKDDVDDYLIEVSEAYELSVKENSLLKDRIEALEERLGHYKQMEENIQKTLLMAQNAAEEAKKNALKESEMIVNNANESSARIMDRAKNDVLKINTEYDELKGEFNKFRAKFRHFMKSQIDMFESLERDFEKSQNVGVRKVENDYEEISYSSFKQEMGESKPLAAVSNGKISDINRGGKRLDSIENIKTFFSE